MTNGPTIASELLASLWVVIPVLTLFGVCEWLFHRRRVDGEITRKISHLGSGLVIFCMPWFIQSHWTVLAMSAGFVAVLGGSKVLGLLPSVHRVSRKTSGAQYYPIAVYVTWLLADGHALLFQIPMAVMALSDTGAAVIGRRYGIVRYRVIEDYRSLGGSVTFFGLTFAVVLVGLGLAGHGDLPTVLLVTLLTAMVATAVEGISVRGADNLLVPYATFIMLRTTMDAGRDGLGQWVLGTALVLGVLLASFRQTRLNTTGFMATFVGGVLAWGLGGPAWLAALLVPYIAFSASRSRTATTEADLEVMVPALAVSLVLVLLYGHTGFAALFVPFLGSVASVSAIALAAAARARLGGVGPEVAAALAGALLALVPAALVDTPLGITPLTGLLIVGGAMLAPLVVRTTRPTALSPAASRFAGVVSGTSTSLFWVVGQALA